MSNLRWILLFSGFAILVLLYFSGRPRNNQKSTTGSRERDLSDEGLDLDTELEITSAGYSGYNQSADLNHDSEARTTGYETHPAGEAAPEAARGVAEPYSANQHHPDNQALPTYDSSQYAPHQNESISMDGYSSTEPVQTHPVIADAHDYRSNHQVVSGSSPAVQMRSQVARPASHQHGVPPIPQRDQGEHFNPAEGFGPMDPSDLARPAATGEDFVLSRDEVQRSLSTENEQRSVASSPISQKITSFTNKLAIRRGNRSEQKRADDAAKEPPKETKDKIVLLHVMAQENTMIDGQLLLDVFESRDYHFGEMDIFHSLHEGKTVFSIAKVVEPGRFDTNDLSSFETPGLALILRLPGPVPGDVAFEVLMSEASELASALGCRVLDSGRSNLSRQTVQHLRESILDYMHRQRYLPTAVT